MLASSLNGYLAWPSYACIRPDASQPNAHLGLAVIATAFLPVQNAGK